MPQLRRFFLRLCNLLRSRAAERELTREVEAHLALIEDDYVQRGLSSTDARVAARRALGGVEQAKEHHRDARSFRWLDDVRRDMTLVLRSLRKHPVSTLVIILTLAIGIGATTAMFSLADALWLRPLRAPHADRLVRFENITMSGAPTQTTGPRDVSVLQQQTTAFTAIGAHWLEYANLTQASYPEQIAVGQVTASFFELFGASTIAGHVFTAVEDAPGGPPIVVLSNALWKRQFDSNSDIIGRTVSLGGESRTVVGVLAPSFMSQQFDPEPDAWEPMQIDPAAPNTGLCIISGLLRSGVTLDAANAQLRAVTHAQPNHREGSETIVVPVRDALVGSAENPILLLSGAVALLLLISIANVAGVLLVRALDRRREISIQAAVGAGRGRIMRQVLAESLTLALAGGIVGVTLGVGGLRLLLDAYRRNNWLRGTDGFLPRLNESLSDITLDWRVVAFAIAVSALTAIVFGLLPAFHAARLDVNASLKASGPGAGGTRRRVTRGVLVAMQLALTVILLVGSGLLVRTSLALLTVNRGYDLDRVLTMRTAINGSEFETPDGIARLSARGAEAIRSVPGTSSATTSCCVPLDVVWQLLFVVEGRPLTGKFHDVAGFAFVSTDYFRTLGIPVLQGRALTESDAADAAPVIVINEAMAQRFWPGHNPIGEHLVIGHGMQLALDQDPPREIVGIVGNVREQQLNLPPRPAMYVPMVQLPAGLLPFLFQQLPLAWIVRTAADPRLVQEPARRALEVATGLPVTQARTMGEVAAASIVRTRFNMMLMAIFGLSATSLACLGIYGFMALLVKQRTRDIGIRMALGAGVDDVRRMIWGNGLTLIAAGVAVGLGGAWLLSRVLASTLFGVTQHDALVFTAVPLLLVATSAAAIWNPVRRATRTDPASTLRYE